MTLKQIIDKVPKEAWDETELIIKIEVNPDYPPHEFDVYGATYDAKDKSLTFITD